MDTCSHLLDGVGGKDVDGLDETLGYRVAVRLQYIRKPRYRGRQDGLEEQIVIEDL